MIKILTSAAIAVVIGAGSFVVPASAQGVSISVGERDHYRGDRGVERRVERRVYREERPRVRVVREERCRTKTIITHRRGEKIIRKVRSCD